MAATTAAVCIIVFLEFGPCIISTRFSTILSLSRSIALKVLQGYTYRGIALPESVFWWQATYLPLNITPIRAQPRPWHLARIYGKAWSSCQTLWCLAVKGWVWERISVEQVDGTFSEVSWIYRAEIWRITWRAFKRATRKKRSTLAWSFLQSKWYGILRTSLHICDCRNFLVPKLLSWRYQRLGAGDRPVSAVWVSQFQNVNYNRYGLLGFHSATFLFPVMERWFEWIAIQLGMFFFGFFSPSLLGIMEASWRTATRCQIRRLRKLEHIMQLLRGVDTFTVSDIYKYTIDLRKNAAVSSRRTRL